MQLKKIMTIWLITAVIGIGFMPSLSAAENSTSEEIAVSLVIDTSGSMADTDPGNLRKTAAEIFVDMLSPEDYVGIVSFSTDVTELAPMQPVGDATNKQTIKGTLAPIVGADGNTNYQLALQKAEQQLDSFTDQNIRKVIIFLTDGVPEPDYALREDSAFMSAYMDTLWQTTAQLGLKNYAVYALGFGTADPSTLQRIATDTRGEAKFLGSSSEIAVNFFEVLRTLKNRQGFWNETMPITGETVLPFQVGNYTSQVTMVVANDTTGTNVTVRSANGADTTGKVVVQKNENYSIVTMNQADKELNGEWELVINGTGNVQLFGDKDLSLKSWLVEPKANTQLTLHEPIDLSVAVTGERNEDMSVEVVVSKNGASETETIPLTLEAGNYVGIYNHVDQAGTYTLDTRIKDGGTIVTNSLTTVYVQQLPVLASEGTLQDAIFKVSENQAVTGYLQMEGTQDITINSFNLVENFADGRQEIYPMRDGEPENSGDAIAGDGVYTVVLPFDEEGDFFATLVVQGNYQGGTFTLEKELGTYHVVSSGEIEGSLVETNLAGKPGGEVTVPVRLKNHSGRSETVHVTMASEGVSSEEKIITLKPNEMMDAPLTVNLSEDALLGKQDFAVNVAAEDPLTIVKADIKGAVTVVSGTALFIFNLWNFLAENGAAVAVVILLPLLAFMIGRLLYVLKMKKALQIPRYLEYKRIDSSVALQKILLPKKIGEIIIGFGETSSDADLVLNGPKIPYLLTVNVTTSHTDRKWLEGYRSLSKAYLPVHIKVVTSQPGIFKLNGEVFTSKEIFDQDSFESGGYQFTYRAEETLHEENKARNVLEGKM
jgi:hypothetical protein